MAHELAGLLRQVDQTEDSADRLALEDRAVGLILELWSKRWSLPEGFGPVSGYRGAIEALHRVDPESNPWLRDGRAELREMFDVLSRCVVGGLLLTLGPRLRGLTGEEREALDDGEREVVSTLEWWAKCAVPIRRELDLTATDTNVADGGVAGAKRPVEADEQPEGFVVPDADALHAAVLEDLERMQKCLSGLLDRWRNARGEAEGAGHPPD